MPRARPRKSQWRIADCRIADLEGEVQDEEQGQDVEGLGHEGGVEEDKVGIHSRQRRSDHADRLTEQPPADAIGEPTM